MNQTIKDKLLWRATIVENSESLIKSCSRNDKNQLSLFESVKNETVSLNVPEDINYEALIEKEVDILGVALTYNIQDRYVLYYKKFCNNTLRSINELTETSNGLIFIAKISDIEYRVSGAGNNYAKIWWKDDDSTTRMYLFGDAYQKLISKAFKGRYYLCEASYNKDKESLNIVRFRAIEDLDLADYITTILIYVEDPESIVELRNYVFSKMIGSTYDLIYVYKGDEFKAPYKINFTEENYCDIKDLIINLNVRNDR